MRKLLSARFLMAIAFTITSCIGFIKGLIPTEAFVPMALLTVQWYFQKSKEESK